MRAIFISYRRDDAEGQAGRLFDDLTRHFGDDAVFMDVAAIEAGRDFRRAIDQQVAACGVLLAIIGKNWVSAKNSAGARRLDDPMDFVRLETASALKRDIPVVPVLVQGAAMPRSEDLPDDLKELTFRNAVELTHARWDSDVQVLTKALQHYVATRPVAAPALATAAPAARETGRSRPIITVAVIVVTLAAAGYVWQRWSSPSAPVRSPGASSRPAATLVGNWSGAAECQFTIERDDGNNIEGSCDTPAVRHQIVGRYSGANTVKITITRTDPNRCVTSVDGFVLIENAATIEVVQDGWNGCEVTTAPAKTRLRRSSAAVSAP